MNAAVTLEQRLAARTMDAVNGVERIRAMSPENAGDIFLLLTQIYMIAADGAHLASGIFLGDAEEGDQEKLIAVLGYIKSNLILIGSVMDGKRI